MGEIMLRQDFYALIFVGILLTEAISRKVLKTWIEPTFFECVLMVWILGAIFYFPFAAYIFHYMFIREKK
jgi:hypothetical protein